MRLHQRTGIWLLLWPCWWGVALGTHGTLDLKLLALLLVGSVVMRGAGCVVNDIVDRKIDAQVERTRLRPLASGELKLPQAIIFLGLLLLIGLFIAWQLPSHALMLACLSLPLVAAYPFMKRLTHWPQAWLGMTFNWGALVGYAAASGRLDTPAWWLYAACIFWTLGYDTIYALQDVKDDMRIGVKSTALTLKRYVSIWVAGFYAVTLVLSSGAGITAGRSWPLWFGIIALGGHFFWQVRTLDAGNVARCRDLFRSNALAGWLLFLGIVLGQ